MKGKQIAIFQILEMYKTYNKLKIKKINKILFLVIKKTNNSMTKNIPFQIEINMKKKMMI